MCNADYENLNRYGDILTPQEVARVLRIGMNSTYKLLSQGIIKSRRVGKKYIVPKLCLYDYLKNTKYMGDNYDG